jgi:hypothetical protein
MKIYQVLLLVDFPHPDVHDFLRDPDPHLVLFLGGANIHFFQKHDLLETCSCARLFIRALLKNNHLKIAACMLSKTQATVARTIPVAVDPCYCMSDY